MALARRPDEMYYSELCAELEKELSFGNSRHFKVLELTREALSRGWHEMATELMNEIIDMDYDTAKAMIAEGVVPNAASLIKCIEGGHREDVAMLDFLIDEVKVVPTIEVLEAANRDFRSPDWRYMLGKVQQAAPADVQQRFKQAEREEHDRLRATSLGLLWQVPYRQEEYDEMWEKHLRHITTWP